MKLDIYEKIIFAVFGGLLIYGFHVCGVFQIINCVNRRLILICRPNDLDTKQFKPYGHWGYYLDLKRWERRSKNDYIQKELDRWYPIIHFLFCSAYIMIFASIYSIIRNAKQLLPFVLLFLGIVSLITALASDYRATKIEFWVAVGRSENRETTSE
ncbi:hypothetical protein GH146_00840 [archaeon]|nr:hypothetical protein [archaeon]